MGEYANYRGEHTKIGTCEEFMYLRPDQMRLVDYRFGEDVLAEAKFRFPFPDEDSIEPGQFDDSDRGFVAWGGYENPAEVQHGKVQFSAQAGILASLPCPYSAEAKALEAAAGIKYHFNGYRGPVRIRYQRVWAGVWATVVECGACRALYRLPELSDAEPLLTALERMAVLEAGRDREGYAKTIREIASRIRTGYTTPAPFAVAATNA